MRYRSLSFQTHVGITPWVPHPKGRVLVFSKMALNNVDTWLTTDTVVEHQTGLLIQEHLNPSPHQSENVKPRTALSNTESSLLKYYKVRNQRMSEKVQLLGTQKWPTASPAPAHSHAPIIHNVISCL